MTYSLSIQNQEQEKQYNLSICNWKNKIQGKN